MTKLDEIAVNIELVLISLIEGVALVTLAEKAVEAMNEPDWYRYIAFVLAGFVLLLAFWAQSILHAVSFIRWPVRVEHMFLYFAAALLQIMAYTSIFDLAGWYFWWTLFSLVVVAMYWLDLEIMRTSRDTFKKLTGGEEYLKEVEARHIYEFKYLVPAAVAFNILMWLTALVIPRFFQPFYLYAIPAVLQLAISSYALYDCTMNFRRRSEMIGKLFTASSGANT